MSKFIKNIPVPLAGLMLALATLGNFLASYGDVYKNLAGGLAGLLFLLLAAKLLTAPDSLREDLKNPVVASVLPTFSMGIMVLSTYIRPIHYDTALTVWALGLAMHVVLIIYFTKHYLIRFNIRNVYPSYFIVYVGIVTGSVTAQAYNLAGLGQVLFWFGLLSNVLLLPFVLYRVLVIQEIPEAALPTLIIFAAPASLCLAGYLATFPEKSTTMVIALASFAVMMILFSLTCLPKALRIPFYPSYSSFTFPFVISAVALKGANRFLLTEGFSVSLLNYAGIILGVWSVIIVCYVLVKYTGYLMPKWEGFLNTKAQTTPSRHP